MGKFKKIEAIIFSMTFKERRNHKILNGSRRKRIARGCGLEVSDVNRFIKRFEKSRQMMAAFSKKGGRPGGLGGAWPF